MDFFRKLAYSIAVTGLFLPVFAQKTLEEVTFDKDENSVDVFFNFSGAVPQFDLERKLVEGNHIAAFIFENTTVEDLGLVEFKSPVQFVHAINDEETGQAIVSLYLEADLDFTRKTAGKKLSVSIPWDEVGALDDPARLNEISTNVQDEDHLSIKLTFDKVPGFSRTFLTEDKKYFVAILYNALPDFEESFDPSPDVLRDFQVESGQENNGTPWVRLSGRSDMELKMERSEEETRLFIHVSNAAAPMAAVPDYDELYETEEAEDPADYTVADVEKQTTRRHGGEEIKDGPNWFYWTLGAGALVGGGIVGLLLLGGDNGGPTDPGGPQPLPPPEIPFPTNPE